MFHIYDHSEKTYKDFKAEVDVACWWNTHFRGMRFDELNVSGRDINMVTVQAGTHMASICGELREFPTYKTIPVLRRYQVFDAAMRSIDIRLWSDSIWEHVPQVSPMCSRWQSGSKPHYHRTAGPALWRRTLRMRADTVSSDELQEDGLPVPMYDRTAYRHGYNFRTADIWDFYEEKADAKLCSSKSWKDQTRARKQWAKHKSGPCRTYRKESEYDDGLFCRLSDEGFPVFASEPAFMCGATDDVGAFTAASVA